MLSDRQALILRKVTEGYLDGGQPVGSKHVAADDEVTWGPSTVRHELAMLEERGLLAHPHTSAGRVPTDAALRLYVDVLLAERGDRRLSSPPLGLSLMRREVDEAMRATTETLSKVTNLLAVVSAPPVDTATIRHIEVLVLQPQVLMVVFITSAGGISKRVFGFDRAIDPGLAAWAASYLREQLTGLGLGARILRARVFAPDLSASEQAFLEAIEPAFSDLAATAEDSLYFDGAARLLAEYGEDASQLNELLALLERRMSMLGVVQAALARGVTSGDVVVRIGGENEAPALRSLAVVGAPYGLLRRPLGAVSVIGPLRMDYGVAIDSVGLAASELSRFASALYDED